MFGIGQTELIIAAVIILILFGHKLPTVMYGLGKGIGDFKKGLNATDDDETPAQATDKKPD